MKPKEGLLEAQEKELLEKLAEIKKGMTQEELEQIQEDQKALKAFQDREDTEEELQKLPMLKERILAKKQPFYIMSRERLAILNLFSTTYLPTESVI